jgi:transforming growth factor-beta-induced protein
MRRNLSCLTLIVALAQATAGCGSDNKNAGGTGGAAEEGTGGSSSGGSKSSGGSTSGGATSTGGTTASSGGAASGGVTSSGGTTGNGGTAATGGATSSGGTAATGGSTNAGGTGGATGAQDIVDTAIAAGSFKKLAGALTTAGLVDALKGKGPFTVFAPNDDAFATFEKDNPGVLGNLTKDELTNILKYHVVSGAAVKSTDLKDGEVVTTLSGSPALVSTMNGVTIDDAKVIKADIVATNGVIHVIDHIILPPKDDLVATAVAAGSFKTLASALTSAGLVSALQAPGPFTVFAPTDDAFKKLSSVPTGDALKNVLLYHVVSGAIGSGDLKAGQVPTLLSGKSLTVDLTNGVKINDAKVTMANVLAKNGVIHVIDTVLVPK